MDNNHAPDEQVLHQSDAATTQLVAAGGHIVIGLDEKPADGVKWVIESPFDSQALFLLADESKKDQGHGVQRRVFRFYVRHKGQGSLAFLLRNPWKAGEPVADQVTFTFDAQ